MRKSIPQTVAWSLQNNKVFILKEIICNTFEMKDPFARDYFKINGW